MTPDLERDLAVLEELGRRGRRPTRHDARPVLLEIGRILESEGPNGLAPAKRRIESFPTVVAAAWALAVGDELSMAATEFVRSVDPRYLGHPKYDWGYTLGVRRDLGWRLRAVQFLGITPDPELSRGIERADALLAKSKPGGSSNSSGSSAEVSDPSNSQS